MESYKIKIEFFKKGNQLKYATKGGVYLIDLLKDDKEEPIHLYVGESGAVIKRCGEHLYKLFNQPDYLGLDLDDLYNSELTLRFCLAKSIENKKKFWWDKDYKDSELKAIHEFKPITQLQTSDRQISNKLEVVQNKMMELGFK